MATLGFLISSFLASIIAVPTLITIIGAILSRTWWQAVLWAAHRNKSATVSPGNSIAIEAPSDSSP